MLDMHKYRSSPQEQERLKDLMGLVPDGLDNVLDIGARDGYIAALLAARCKKVTALDLKRPSFNIERVENVQGDVTRLDFPDNSFDAVLCAEVLEHIPPAYLQKACAEIARVSRKYVLIGVPYNQDIRVGRTVCASCKRINPPWGHVNVLNDRKLKGLFSGLEPLQTTLVGSENYRTNFISTFLMDLAGNPWGSYIQEEPCIHCGSKLVAPAKHRSTLKKCFSKAAVLINSAQRRAMPEKPIWVHMLFRKNGR